MRRKAGPLFNFLTWFVYLDEHMCTATVFGLLPKKAGPVFRCCARRGLALQACQDVSSQAQHGPSKRPNTIQEATTIVDGNDRSGATVSINQSCCDDGINGDAIEKD